MIIGESGQNRDQVVFDSIEGSVSFDLSPMKIILVENCYDCTHLKGHSLPIISFCFHPERQEKPSVISDPEQIPSWCPLPDAPDKKEGIAIKLPKPPKKAHLSMAQTQQESFLEINRHMEEMTEWVDEVYKVLERLAEGGSE